MLDFADIFAGRPVEQDANACAGAGKASAERKTERQAERRNAAAPGDADELTETLLSGWWTAATRIGTLEGHPDRRRRPAHQPEMQDSKSQRSALSAALGTSAYFRGSPELAGTEARALSRYLTDLKLRHEVRDRTQAAILPDTKVVVGHGIGALIAYEALCALSDAVSVAFVSLGAAMCGPEPVFARLEPAPRNEQGHWPAAIRRWFNVVAHSDPTAMVAPQLTERFGPGIEDEVIEIKSNCGDLQPYLLDRATGRALATGLAG